jgi:hypothetical protein
MPPPHLLTRTLASPACVSQIPLTSPPACAFAGDAPSQVIKQVIKIAAIKPNLQVIKLSPGMCLHSNKSSLRNAVFAPCG